MRRLEDSTKRATLLSLNAKVLDLASEPLP